ncbi:MAG: hypothetical protein WKF60_01545 [Ilumatobacter sp.]
MTSAPMIAFQAGQIWTAIDGNDTITINHSEESRWVVAASNGDNRTMIASNIRTQYHFVAAAVHDD